MKMRCNFFGRLVRSTAVLIALLAGVAQSSFADNIEVDHVRLIVPASAGQPGILRLSINNLSAAADRLVGASVEGAGRSVLHSTHATGKMREAIGIDLPARSTVTLTDRGSHVMVLDIGSSLRPGSTTKVRLAFEKMGSLTVQAKVTSAEHVRQHHTH